MSDQPISTGVRRRWLMPAVIVVALIGGTIAFLWRTVHANETSFLNTFDGADWIVFPMAYFPSARPALAFDATFRKAFSLTSAPRAATLHVRALREGSVTINGQPVPLKLDTRNWRNKATIDVTSFLRAGQNTISATIQNGTGPPALWLRLVTDEVSVQSDSTWECSIAGSAWRRATSARDRDRPNPDERISTSFNPLKSLQITWPWLILFGVIAAIVIMAIDRAQLSPESIALLVLAICSIAWIALLVHNTSWLPSHVGFDATGHQSYIRFIADRGKLPLPSDGWTMYHPPLYYLINAGVLKLLRFDLQRTSIIHAIRSLNFLFGIANLALVLASMRLLFPDRPHRWLIGLTLAAFLPCNLYLHQYPTNEVLVALLMSAAIYIALRIVIRHEQKWWLYVVLGLSLGAAMLTKVSALIPLMIIFATLSLVAFRSRRDVAKVVTAIVIAVLVCGWHYVRIYNNFGTPFVSNWDPRAGYAWWQDPGFHTSADYLRFGRAFVQPIFNIGLSVPDALYATLWGDGQLGGPIAAEFRPPWSYDFMSTGYVLAIVPTICVIVGVFTVLARVIRRFDPAWTMLIAIFLSVVGAIVLLTLRVPHFGSAKAFYALMTLIPFCALAVIGIDVLSFGNRYARGAIAGMVIVFALNAYASFWIRTDDPEARTVIAARLFDMHDIKQAESLLRSALQVDPNNAGARLMLAQYLIERRQLAEARKWLDLAPGQADSAPRHMLIAQTESFAGQAQLARREVERAIQLDPELADAYIARGELARQAGDVAAAASIDANREALAFNPYIDAVHQQLADAYQKLGDVENADRHRKYFAMLRSIAPAK